MRISARHGIAIAPILFIVALLAVLATAIAAGSGTFSSGSSDKGKVLAKTIIDRAVQYRAAVQRLLALGCSETQLSFYSTGVYSPGSHVNANAPADKHCDMFDPAGAGGLDPKITTDWGDYSLAGFNPVVFFQCGSAINGIGTAKPELLYTVQDLSKQVCDEINRLLGITTISSTYDNSFCNGTFDDATPFSVPNVTGKTDYCIQVNSSQRYTFISVLLPR